VPHPPAAFLGPSHVFRAPDGGGNCLEDPDRGRAGTAYARSVQTKFAQPRSALPDPGLIFDTLLKRRGIEEHHGGTSAFTFAYATLVTHSIFMTDQSDWSKNNTSSYLDLSPLYGHSACPALLSLDLSHLPVQTRKPKTQFVTRIQAVDYSIRILTQSIASCSYLQPQVHSWCYSPATIM
jgi:hypothetical protein